MRIVVWGPEKMFVQQTKRRQKRPRHFFRATIFKSAFKNVRLHQSTNQKWHNFVPSNNNSALLNCFYRHALVHTNRRCYHLMI